jgi:hypothetical protein
MTSAKARNLKTSMTSELESVDDRGFEDVSQRDPVQKSKKSFEGRFHQTRLVHDNSPSVVGGSLRFFARSNDFCQGTEFEDLHDLVSKMYPNGIQFKNRRRVSRVAFTKLGWFAVLRTPLGYIFETPIINTLLTRFLGEPEFRNVTLKCLTEI